MFVCIAAATEAAESAVTDESEGKPALDCSDADAERGYGVIAPSVVAGWLFALLIVATFPCGPLAEPAAAVATEGDGGKAAELLEVETAVLEED
mmetsp:Transcript_8088/g.23102  ORF Transcript_8088/g.23102 Transcript_8088/m.23102 type:complete len:94 (+) Transcript_8088:174-455(+)